MAAVSPSGAADIPAAQPYKAPIAVPMKQSWYGFYIGANAGYAWGNNSVEFGPDAFYGPFLLAAGIPTTLAGNPKGFVGGITYGSNYQFDRLVIGLDSDFDFSNIKASQTFAGTILAVPFTATATHEIKWFSTTRARAGLPAKRQLVALRDRRYRHGQGRGVRQQRPQCRGRLRCHGRRVSDSVRRARRCGAGRPAPASNTPAGPGSSASNICTTISER